jgi:hypothetical protein
MSNPNYPRITVTQMQLRNAMIQMELYSQWDGNYRNSATLAGRVYWDWSPTIDSDSPHFNDDNTTIDEAQRYSTFQLAQTL